MEYRLSGEEKEFKSLDGYIKIKIKGKVFHLYETKNGELGVTTSSKKIQILPERSNEVIIDILI
jgi:hypothetical protein